jgi:hypothetical protein
MAKLLTFTLVGLDSQPLLLEHLVKVEPQVFKNEERLFVVLLSTLKKLFFPSPQNK